MGVGAVAGLAGMAIGAAGQFAAADAARPGGFYPERDASHWMNAFYGQSPGQYGLEAMYQPMYSNLGLNTTEGAIFGTKPQKTNQRVLRWDRKKNKYIWQDHVVQKPGQRGMLDIMRRAQPQLDKMYYDSALRFEDFQRGQTTRAMDWMDRLDPSAMAMDKELTGQAMEELKLGSQLSPAEEEEVKRRVRQGQAARGFGLGNADIFEEAMELGSAGEMRQEGRRRFAMDVAGRRPNPLSLLYGTTPTGGSPTAGLGASTLGAGFDMTRGSGPRLFDPWRSPGLQPSNVAGAGMQAAAAGGIMNLGGQMAMQSIYNRNQPPAAGAVRGAGNDWYAPQTGNGGQYYSAWS